MTRHRFYLPSEIVRDAPVPFPADLARQIRQVLRLRTGDLVTVFNGSGLEYDLSLTVSDVDVTGIAVAERRNTAEPSTALTMYPGMIKGPKFEIMLQKCTEIGVTRIAPTITALSVAQEPGATRHRRYLAIIREAAEQSGRGRLPELMAPVPLTVALNKATTAGTVVFLWEQEVDVTIERLALTDGPPIALFVGPEGGFTQEEAQYARDAGAYLVTLGPRILRAETAAIVGCALLLARLETL